MYIYIYAYLSLVLLQLFVYRPIESSLHFDVMQDVVSFNALRASFKNLFIFLVFFKFVDKIRTLDARVNAFDVRSEVKITKSKS